MKIFLDAGSPLRDGLDTAGGGEIVYIENIVKALAEAGHECDIPGSLGRSAPRDRVNFVPEYVVNKEYDIAIGVPFNFCLPEHSGWQNCSTYPIKAKVYVHCTFSWTAGIMDVECYKKDIMNHVFVCPYREGFWQSFNNPKQKQHTFFLPFPLYDQFINDPLENKKDILWATKDAFHSAFPPDHPIAKNAIYTLRSLKKLSDKYGFRTHFISTNMFSSTTGKHYGAMDILNSIKNKTVANTIINRQDFISLIRSSRVNAVVGNLSGSHLESVVIGTVPVVSDGHFMIPNVARDLGLELLHRTVTEQEIYNMIELLYTDDDLWHKALKSYQNCLSEFSHERTAFYFEEMCNKLKDLDLL